MATDQSVPPWEDADIPLAEDIDLTNQSWQVTQTQFQALLTMVRAQATQLRELQRIVAELRSIPQKATNAPQQDGNERHAGGKLLKGQHRGKTHAQVLATDPAYVNYLAVNGWAENWGFTDEYVKKAAEWCAANPDRGRR